MASLNLSDTPSRIYFFQQTIYANLHFWQTWLKTHLAQPEALDRERHALAKAISFALPLDETWSLVFELVQTLTPLMERRGHWDTWQWVLTRSLETAQRVKDTAAEVTLSALLARLLFQQSQFKKGVAGYRRTLRLARQIGDRFNEARACTNLGYHFIEHGYWQRAEVLCCHALALFEQLDSNHGRAHTENHLGFLYTRQHRWEQAQYHLERACEIWQAMADGYGLMLGYLNLGGLYNDSGKPDRALNYLAKGLQQAEQIGEFVAIGRIYINQGKAYRLLGDWAKAEVCTKQAEAIFQQCTNLTELARSWNGLGLIYFHQARWTEADFYLEKSLGLWRRLGIQFEEIELLLDIGECELARGNAPEAIRRWHEVDQLISPPRVQQIYRHLQPRLHQYHHKLNSMRLELER
ncbi:MAG: tetratricopeptide repeat protein [Anaerolineae bacterium]|nr:tetratricopeptide repeat protein [Anaerolineae bacterium]